MAYFEPDWKGTEKDGKGKKAYSVLQNPLFWYDDNRLYW
jgi:hypothetical protein